MTTLSLENMIDRCNSVDPIRLYVGCQKILSRNFSPDIYRKFPESFLLVSIYNEIETREQTNTFGRIPLEYREKANTLLDIFCMAKESATKATVC